MLSNHWGISCLRRVTNAFNHRKGSPQYSLRLQMECFVWFCLFVGVYSTDFPHCFFFRRFNLLAHCNHFKWNTAKLSDTIYLPNKSTLRTMNADHFFVCFEAISFQTVNAEHFYSVEFQWRPFDCKQQFFTIEKKLISFFYNCALFPICSDSCTIRMEQKANTILFE